MAEKHFTEQKAHAETYLIPYFERIFPDFQRFRILEIGCAEAGFLYALHQAGIQSEGLELEPHRVALAKAMNPKLKIRVGDVTDPDIVSKIGKSFDLVVLRDVIEHIPDRDVVFRNLSILLRPEGFAYITFPPRFSPFAGHHQNGRSALRRMPFLHLLPEWMIRFLGRGFREHAHILDNAALNFRIGLSIQRFEAFCHNHGFKILIKDLFLLRPIYHTRTGLKPRRIPDIPVFREFLSLGCECLIRKS